MTASDLVLDIDCVIIIKHLREIITHDFVSKPFCYTTIKPTSVISL